MAFYWHQFPPFCPLLDGRRPSLFYNMSARHKRHKSNMNDTSATGVQHEWDTSNMSGTQVQHECYTNDTSATQVINSDFDIETSQIFPHPYISYMANARLQGEEQFHSKKYLLEMPCSHPRRNMKSVPQKLNFIMGKAISKRYTLDCSCKCSCTFPHSCA